MFNNLLGNNNNKKNFETIIKNNNISHSYIFSGIAGIGKFLFAKEFAKALLCTDESNKPCGKCKSCESFENQNNPDITIIDESDDSIKTEQIRELTSNVLEKPIQGSRKVYIINNSENMTKEAQNCLLKTLEEPPEYVVIILIVNNENLLLSTIKSRCLKIPFTKLADEDIQLYFSNNNLPYTEELLKASNGSIGKALEISDKSDIFENVTNVFTKIDQMNELQILKIKDEIFKDKEEIFWILDYINTIFYGKIVENLNKAEKYEKCIQAVENTKIRLKRNANYDMCIDYLLLEIERSFEE